MLVFCVLSGVILLNGCTSQGGGNVQQSNASESTGYVSYSMANNVPKNTSPTNKSIKAAKQKQNDAESDNLSQLPEYIMIRI